MSDESLVERFGHTTSSELASWLLGNVPEELLEVWDPAILHRNICIEAANRLVHLNAVILEQWVSTEVELPDVGAEVLGAIAINYWPHWQIRRVLVRRNPAGKKFFRILDGEFPAMENADVRYWLPLPECPERRTK